MLASVAPVTFCLRLEPHSFSSFFFLILWRTIISPCYSPTPIIPSPSSSLLALSPLSPHLPSPSTPQVPSPPHISWRDAFIVTSSGRKMEINAPRVDDWVSSSRRSLEPFLARLEPFLSCLEISLASCRFLWCFSWSTGAGLRILLVVLNSF